MQLKSSDIHKILKKNIDLHAEKLTRVKNVKAKDVSDEEIYSHIMSDADLLAVIADEVKTRSKPIHAGKTMDALRVVYGKMNPEISPRLVDKRVRETISHNIRLSKRHFGRKSISPFLELYNMEKSDKQK